MRVQGVEALVEALDAHPRERRLTMVALGAIFNLFNDAAIGMKEPSSTWHADVTDPKLRKAYGTEVTRVAKRAARLHDAGTAEGAQVAETAKLLLELLSASSPTGVLFPPESHQTLRA